MKMNNNNRLIEINLNAPNDGGEIHVVAENRNVQLVGDQQPVNIEENNEIFIPLQFWFNREPTMAYQTRFGFIEGTADEIRAEIHRLEELERQIEIDGTNEPIIIEEDEFVNGYQLYQSQPNLCNDDIDRLITLWNKPNFESFNEFYNKCYDTFCTDWSKMDPNGESFGGFWDVEDKDSDDYKNAWIYSRRQNILELYKLPYPDRVLIKSVKLGCSCRDESVRYSNHLCETFRRKIIQQRPDIILPTKLPILDSGFDDDQFIKLGKFSGPIIKSADKV